MIREITRGDFRRCIEAGIDASPDLTIQQRAALRLVGVTSVEIGTNFGDPEEQPCCPASLAGIAHVVATNGLADVIAPAERAVREFAYGYDDAVFALFKRTLTPHDVATFWARTASFRVVEA